MTTGTTPDAWLDDLLQATTDHGFIVMDAAGIVQAWRGAAERLFGYAAEEVIGRHINLIFTREDVARGLDVHEVTVALAAGRSEDDRWHVRKDGSRFWASGAMARLPARDGGAPLLCKIMRDRTDMRMQIEALENAVDARDSEIEEQGNLLAATTHELRNPLNPMAIALELLKRSSLEGPAAQAVGIFENQLAVLTALVNDMSQSIDTGRVDGQLSVGRLDLHEALRRECAGLQDVAVRAGLDLRLLLPAVTIWVAADPARLAQMMGNLVGNALKYTPAGGHVNVTASIEAGMAVVRVEDDGVGISPSVLPHVFELFTREGRDPQVPGMGVGLAIVRHLAQLHDGSVEARSAGPGKGSVFTLRLPLA